MKQQQRKKTKIEKEKTRVLILSIWLYRKYAV